MEALASGTPVVTVDQAPLTEMIDDSVGGLFACGDHEDLARAVIHCLDRPEERTEQMKRGRQRVLDRFTYEHKAPAYEAIYSSLFES